MSDQLVERQIGIALGLFLFQAEDGIRYLTVTGVQTCALPISRFGRGADDRIDVQVALRRKRAANPSALVHHRPMEGCPVGFRVHSNAADPHSASRMGHPDRDLAAVRDEHTPEHAPPTQSGMLPCFLGGRVSRFVRSTVNASITRGRVSAGSITSSRYPMRAAMYGFANRSRYSLTSSASRFAGALASSISFLKMIWTAPSVPITASSAEGQAQLKSPRMCFEHMTSYAPP